MSKELVGALQALVDEVRLSTAPAKEFQSLPAAMQVLARYYRGRVTGNEKCFSCGSASLSYDLIASGWCTACGVCQNTNVEAPNA